MKYVHVHIFVGKILFWSLIQSPLKMVSYKQQSEKARDNVGREKNIRCAHGSGYSWKNASSYFHTKGEELVQNTPTIPGNNF